MVQAVSADRQLETREAAARAGRNPERAVRDLIEQAVQPLAAQPPLRARLLEMRREKDILYDENGIVDCSGF